MVLPHAVGLLHLAPLIREFMTPHPELRFEPDFNDRQIDLMQESVDLAIRIATLAESSLMRQPPKAHPRSGPGPLLAAIDEIALERVIRLAAANALARQHLPQLHPAMIEGVG